MDNEKINLPADFGKDEISNRIVCLFNADVKDFIYRLERYDGSYIDKRFWKSQFWEKLRSEFVSP